MGIIRDTITRRCISAGIFGANSEGLRPLPGQRARTARKVDTEDTGVIGGDEDSALNKKPPQDTPSR